MLAMVTRIRWITGFLGLISIWATTIALEFFSWKYDYFKQMTVNLTDWGVNFNQILGGFFILIWFYWIFRVALSWNKEKDLIF